jgi:septum formation protein
MSKHLSAVALASRSPRRKYLLETVGLSVDVVSSAYDEALAGNSVLAAETALRHALGKAELAETCGPPVLVAADTLVAIDGQLLGKPRDAAQARSMLRALAGREHTVFTGFVVTDRETGRTASGVESAAVHFLPLSEPEIDADVATGEPLDKAGAYGILGRGSLLVSSINGDFYTVVGLPLARIGTSLHELGYDILA